jgi:hypothetical protein
MEIQQDRQTKKWKVQKKERQIKKGRLETRKFNGRLIGKHKMAQE